MISVIIEEHPVTDEENHLIGIAEDLPAAMQLVEAFIEACSEALDGEDPYEDSPHGPPQIWAKGDDGHFWVLVDDNTYYWQDEGFCKEGETPPC